MAAIVKIKRGNSTPTTSVLEDYELGYNKANDGLYINDDGTIRLTGLPISGGTITGNLTVDGTLNRSCLSAYEHSCIGTHGGSGYVLAIRITVLDEYQNTPMLFDVIQRGGAAYQIKIILTNTSSINPNISSFKSYGDGGTRAWIYKSADSTFDIYIQKVEAYDAIRISRSSCSIATQRSTSGVKYEYLNVMATTLPDGAVQSTNYSMETVPSATDVGALPISGGTLTGALSTKADQYWIHGNYGINMQKSDIVGCNRIVFSDDAGSGEEGISFYRDATHYDTLRASNGSLYFHQNTELTGSGTTRTVYHTGYKPSATDVGALPISGGTLTGALNVTGKLTCLDNSNIVAKLNNYSTIAFTSSAAGECGIGCSVLSGTTISHYLRITPTALKFNNSSGTVTTVYHTGYKPSATDVGALPISGGTLTGALNVTGTLSCSDDRNILAKNGDYRAMVLSDGSNKYLFGGSTGTTSFTQCYIRIGTSALEYYRTGQTIANVYHTGYKNISSSTLTISNNTKVTGVSGTFIVFVATPFSGATPMSTFLCKKDTEIQVADDSGFSRFKWSGTTLERTYGTGVISHVVSFTMQ